MTDTQNLLRTVAALQFKSSIPKRVATCCRVAPLSRSTIECGLALSPFC